MPLAETPPMYRVIRFHPQQLTLVNPDTRQSYLLTMPGPESVRQAALELERK